MIQVAGKPFDRSSLTYPQNSVEALVLDIMEKSGHTYSYDTQEALEFELAVRKETVNAARALYDSDLAFATFHESRCNPAYWERIGNGGFQMKKGVSAGEAIRDIYENGGEYATECATAMLIVYYKALLEVYGKDRFDRTFPDIFLMDWSIRQPLLEEVGTPREVADILYGDRAYFINEDVDPQVPWWRGENVIVLSNGLYYGHGTGILSADQVTGHLNANRKKGSEVEAHLLGEVSRPDFKKLYSAGEALSVRPLVWSFPAFPGTRA